MIISVLSHAVGHPDFLYSEFGSLSFMCSGRRNLRWAGEWVVGGCGVGCAFSTESWPAFLHQIVGAILLCSVTSESTLFMVVSHRDQHTFWPDGKLGFTSLNSLSYTCSALPLECKGSYRQYRNKWLGSSKTWFTKMRGGVCGGRFGAWAVVCLSCLNSAGPQWLEDLWRPTVSNEVA